MSTTAESFHNMAQTIEPDVQATLSDFLTYTEHFPSHLTRALTLISAESNRVEDKIALIHADATTYGLLPTLAEKEDSLTIRKRISHALEEAERAGRMRLAEAARLAEQATRERARLALLTQKLRLIPLPSRDPTPEASGTLTSPNLGRTARFGVDASPDKVNRRLQHKAGSKIRARKITVPGEVLPPPDPDAVAETMSDWSSGRSSPDFDEVMRRKHAALPRPRSRTPKPPRPERSERADRDRKLQRPRGPRQPGQPGTNAHSAVAGISTSNALLALNPPPPGAAKGSRWLPWMKLTEWEMATLRKRMKKNAIWVPSATMLRRELKDLGRGITGREEARVAAAARGEHVLDESTEPDPTRLPQPIANDADDLVTLPGVNAESSPTAYQDGVDEAADAALTNRGMKLNEAKKIKRARLVQEQLEAAAQIEREQDTERNTGNNTATESLGNKKRKRVSTPDVQSTIDMQETPDPLSKAGPPPRKLKLTHIASTRPSDRADKATSARKATLASVNDATSNRNASRAAERNKIATPPPSLAAGVAKKPTLVLKASKAVSEEPPNRRASLRRTSNASLPSTGLADSARERRGSSRRNKRPVPGLVRAIDDDKESARVSASRRKTAPRRNGTSAKPQTSTGAAAEVQSEDEQIDSDATRYCICDDVSYGTMIACENPNCEKEWFHLGCIGLTDMPPRRTKWYCPECRKKLKQGQNTNGLVGRLVATAGGS